MTAFIFWFILALAMAFVGGLYVGLRIGIAMGMAILSLIMEDEEPSMQNVLKRAGEIHDQDAVEFRMKIPPDVLRAALKDNEEEKEDCDE